MARIFKSLVLAGLALGLLGVVAVAGVLLHFSRDLPPVEQAQNLELHQPLRVFAQDGQLIGEFGAERREPLDWENVPQTLIDAFLAAEDDRFYSHPGVDYQGILRAVWVLVTTGDKAQGGSTITMQLARNLFLSNEKSYVRKIREILLALELERRFEKNEILRLYLNKIYLGQRAYGVAAAARIYYGKQVDELTLDEAAMIAGLPKAPSAYNPVANPRRARLRRDYVLRRMRELGKISTEEELAAKEVQVLAKLAPAPVTLSANYVAEMVRSEMYSRYGEAIYTAGVEVYTTIDADLQRAATAAVREGVLDYDARHGWRGVVASRSLESGAPVGDLVNAPEGERIDAAQELLEDIPGAGALQPVVVVASSADGLTVLGLSGELIELSAESIAWPAARELPVGSVSYLRTRPSDGVRLLAQAPQVQSALVAIDPSNGALRAVVGGFDFFVSKFNRATQALRQPGSSFKPFLYSAGLDAGLTTASILNDAPVVFNDPALGGAWKPENYDGRFRGPTRFRDALVRSSNLVSIRVLQEVGISRFRDYVTRFGLSTNNLPRDLSIALGSGTFTPEDMAAAYTVIANGGWKVEPWFISKVVTTDAGEVESADPLVVCRSCWDEAQREQENPPEPTAVPESEVSIDGVDESAELTVEKPLRVAPQVADPANIFIIADMMRDVIQRGTGRKARALGRDDIAGKTGTTNEQRDAWFAGFHPDLVAVTWIGFDDLEPLGRGETGGRAALPIWMNFMAEALPRLPVKHPDQPPGVVTARIDPETGLLSSQGKFEYFLEGHLPEASPQQDNLSYGESSDAGVESDTTDVLDELY